MRSQLALIKAELVEIREHVEEVKTLTLANNGRIRVLEIENIREETREEERGRYDAERRAEMLQHREDLARRIDSFRLWLFGAVGATGAIVTLADRFIP